MLFARPEVPESLLSVALRSTILQVCSNEQTECHREGLDQEAARIGYVCCVICLLLQVSCVGGVLWGKGNRGTKQSVPSSVQKTAVTELESRAPRHQGQSAWKYKALPMCNIW